MLKWLTAGAIVALVLALPAAAGVPHLVTATSIGGVGLGRSASDYTRAIGEQPSRFRLPDGETKLVFAKASLAVTLDPSGRGIAVLTNLPRYATKHGTHPCGSITALRQEFPGRLLKVKQYTTHQLIAYRVGNLIFSLYAGKVGAIMLSDAANAASVAANAAQCGSGVEGR